MEEVKAKEPFLNPYVIQMDKLSESLRRMTDTFLKQESYRVHFTKEEIMEIFEKVTKRTCDECEKKETCLTENREKSYQMMYEILDAANEYGVELTTDIKKRLQKSCMRAPRFLRETLECTQICRKDMVWNNRMIQNREGYIKQLYNFAQTIQYTTRELDAGIFQDEYLEKKIRLHLRKSGVKVLSMVFYITPQGRYEIHLTLRAAKGNVIATKELASEIGHLIGRNMTPTHGERAIVGDEYCTVACVEGARFHTLQGVAKIGKGCEKISGDTFLMTDLPGGKKGVALSDGMGAGEKAFQESAVVVEMLEELLNAGFPVRTAVQMMNTALVIGREDVKFTTIDVGILDLYTGACEFVKAGAAASFIKRGNEVTVVRSMSLPIGVIQDIEMDTETIMLKSGDFIIMVTDGIIDALKSKEQESLLREYIKETVILNPKELAHQILGKVLEISGEVPLDDMTVLVIGIWEM